MIRLIKTSFIMVFVLMVLCGIIYPIVVTGISQGAFNNKANGSLISVDEKVVGSELIGQNITDERFFYGRPSAVNYNTYEDEKDIKLASGSSNLGPSNEKLVERVRYDIKKLLKDNESLKVEDIPIDLITESASGLDPNISVESAKLQIERVSKNTDIESSKLEELVKLCTENKTLGIFGEERINVLKLNIEVAKILKINGKL